MSAQAHRRAQRVSAWSAQKPDTRPQRGLWAPGEYLNVCLRCHARFIGDKRAGMCAACAYAEATTP